MPTIRKNGKLYTSGGANYREVTLAEYELLGDKVNNDGVIYFVKDDNEDGQKNFVNIRYNSEKDTIECLVNGVWTKWKTGGLGELVELIPYINANSQDGYVVSCTGTIINNGAVYKAFDGDTTTRLQFYSGTTDSSFVISIQMPSVVLAKKLYMKMICNRISNCTITGSTDGSAFETIKTFSTTANISEYEIDLENEKECRYFKFTFSKAPYLEEGTYHLIIYTLQLFGSK